MRYDSQILGKDAHTLLKTVIQASFGQHSSRVDRSTEGILVAELSDVTAETDLGCLNMNNVQSNFLEALEL